MVQDVTGSTVLTQLKLCSAVRSKDAGASPTGCMAVTVSAERSGPTDLAQDDGAKAQALRSVLLVAYYFPPFRASGVYRPLKFAKYLPEFGWKPTILTVSNQPEGSTDDGLLGQLPDCATIYRAWSLEPKRLENRLYDSMYRRGSDTRSASASAEAITAAAPSGSPSAIAMLKDYIKRFVLTPLRVASHELYVPDDVVGWLPFAVAKGLQAIREQRVEAIITTAPPATCHLVGLTLSRITGLPWIADYRDPWTDNFIRDDSAKWRRSLERSLESRVLARADRVVHVGERLRELSLKSFPHVDARKHRVIFNGFDENDFASAGTRAYNAAPSEPLELINIGTIYPNSSFPTFIDGLRRWLEQGGGRNLTVSLVASEHDIAVEVLELLKTEPVKSHVRILGFKPHREAVRLMTQADGILFMPSGGNDRAGHTIIPGKLFELMRSGRPVILIGGGGEAAEILASSGTGESIASDPASIADRLDALVERKRAGQLATEPNWGAINRFERRTQTGELAGILDEVTSTR